MAIGLAPDALESMLRQDVLAIMDTQLNQTYELLVKNIATAIVANNAERAERRTAAPSGGRKAPRRD